VPIYNYTAGKLSLPISVNYSGAGVKVDEMATWVGVNWVVTAGGVITRKTNDAPDESIEVTRKYINKQDLLDNADNTCSAHSQYYYELCWNKDLYDTEVDVFNYSFNGYSGSFYLDENFNPVAINDDSEIKIEILGNDATNLLKLRNTKTFLITTPDGIKYYFGGNETESTLVFSGHRTGAFPSNSSFYLYKIEHPVNGTIILEYDQTVKGHLSFMNKSYNIVRPIDGIDSAMNVPTPSETLFVTQINNPKVLSKIRSLNNGIQVYFNSTSYPSRHFVSVLNNIEIKTESSDILKKVDFNYIHPTDSFQTASRFFLESIKIDKEADIDGKKHEEYYFEYNDPLGLPERLTNGQDILGYYNGLDLNKSLIPDNIGFNPSHSDFFVDRHPNFIFASRGALTKVTYPTKGFSTFEYEPSPAKEKKYKSYPRFINGGQIATVPGNDESGTMQLFTPVYKDQDVVVKISTGYSESLDPNIDPESIYQASHGVRIQLKITDVTPNVSADVIPTITRALGSNPIQTLHSIHFSKDHIYQVEFKFLGSASTYLNAALTMDLFDGYNRIEGFGVRIKRQKDFSDENSYANNEVRYYYGRINGDDNQVDHFPEIDYVPKYSLIWTFNPLAPSSAQSSNTSMNIFSDPGNKYCNDANNEVYDLVSLSYGGDNFENGGMEKYFFYMENYHIERIKIAYDGCYLMDNIDTDWNVDAGYDENHILVFPNDDFPPGPNAVVCGLPQDEPAFVSGLTSGNGTAFFRNHATSFEQTDCSTYNGKLLAERYFSKKNGILYKTKEVYNDYYFTGMGNNQATSFVGRTLFGYEAVGSHCNYDLSGPEYKPLSSCYIGYYQVNNPDMRLRSVVTKEYIEPIPISLYRPFMISVLNWNIDVDDVEVEQIESQFKKIVTTQNNTYGALRGLPIETTVTTSDDNRILKTKNFYPTDASTLNGLTNEQIHAYSTLVNQNRIASPIQVQQYENNDLLSTQRTLYKSWNNNTQILPEIIQTAKGTQPLEDRAVFTEYDAKGNPTVMSLKDGTKTKYFYNALNQVIAKVENYSDALNIPATPNLSNACAFITQYPQAVISVYNYDAVTNQIVSIVAPNCKTMYYVYNALHQLQAIKDNDGNIVQEFEHNYKPQN